jgi:hypothetical protein
MGRRRNDYDVTNRIRTTDPADIRDEVCTIFRGLFPHASCTVIERGIRDAARLYRGQYPGYAPCDTSYHNLQHTLDVTLAMARIMAGYQVGKRGPALTPDLFRFGVLTALFHDAGYIRRERDVVHGNGAEYTRIHVSRGGRFLRDYLPRIGMEKFVEAAGPTLHFTGYEKSVRRIRVPDPIFRLIGSMLGSADIIAQMSDRCYLEKCYERLYPEFVLGGIDRKTNPDGTEIVLFESAEDLIFRTPEFYRKAMDRLEHELDAMVRHAGGVLGGRNLYVQESEKNIRYAARLSDEKDLSALRRRPPLMVEGAEDARPREVEDAAERSRVIPRA